MSHVVYYSDISFVTKTTVRTVNDVPFFLRLDSNPPSTLSFFTTAIHALNRENESLMRLKNTMSPLQ